MPSLVPPRLEDNPLAIQPREWDEPSEDTLRWKENVFKRVLSDQKFLVTIWWPSELKNPGFAAPMAGGLATVLSSRESTGVDQRLEQSAHNGIDRSGERAFAHGLTRLGNAPVLGLLLGTSYLVGRWSDSRRASETASLGTEALLDAGIWVTFLKLALSRTRPAGGGAGDFFEYRTSGGQIGGSFPSGHAMGSFALATVFAQQYRDKRWVPWVAYGTASLIGASRVVLGRHFPSDVIVGATLGNSIGRMVIARSHGDRGPMAGQFQPIFDLTHRAYGLAYSRSW